VKNQKGIKNRSFFFLISFLFLTSLLSIKTLKKVDLQDIRISGSELFSQNDVVKNSSLNFPIRLIFVKTNLLEKELKQNLSLKNVSVNRELFPFGLKVHLDTRTPIAYGERVLNDEKILGFIDKDGIFISKNNADEKNLKKLKIQVFGWKENSNQLTLDYLKEVNDYGVNRLIYTDINRDGMKQSPNFDETLRVAEISNCPVIISGGVSSIDDIKKAKTLKNIEGVIVGKAIYDGDIELDELVKEDA